MSDHTDTTLTDTERRYAYEHFGDDDEHFGRCYLEADVESIVAARVAAARADEHARIAARADRYDLAAKSARRRYGALEAANRDPWAADRAYETWNYYAATSHTLRVLIKGADQ